MGPDLELKGRSDIVMEGLGNKETVDVQKEQEDKHVRCASNYEYNTFDVEAVMNEPEGADISQDVEVNILEHTNSNEIGLVGAEFQDATESSSSFDDTDSMQGDASSELPFDEYSENFRMRKKRLTPHWRTYIRPLMWRSKWVELQIKKFQSQAIKYDREIAEYNRIKQLELENCTLEGCGTKSHPFSGQSRRKKVMKRKKRKRVEDTVDIATYMSQHNLFSYYDNKSSVADTASVDDDRRNQVICAEKINGNNEIRVNDESLYLEFIDGDDSLEQILWKIGTIESQVSKMKTRLDKIMSENAGRFSSTDNLCLLAPCNALASSARNPASARNNTDRMPVGSSYIATQLKPEYNVNDLVLPESAASSHGEVTHVPDIIESTDQPEVGGSSINNGDGILRYNRRAKEELNNFKEVNIQPIETAQITKEEQDSSVPPLHHLEPDLPADDQPTPKIRSISKLTATKNKRKRGRRKAGSGRWSRRSSG